MIIALGKPDSNSSELFANKKITKDNWTFWIKTFLTHYPHLYSENLAMQTFYLHQ